MRQLSPFNITRIKSITNKFTNKAYLDLTKDSFVLHWPDNKRKNILSAGEDEIIVLFQKLDSKQNKLTHLVIPKNNKEVSEGNRNNYQYGREVEVLAVTNTDNAIEFSSTSLSSLNFRNRGWGTSDLITDIAGTKDISKIQIEIWNRFRPYFTEDFVHQDIEYQYLMNCAELDDKSGTEGTLKLVTHKIRERDRNLIMSKKMEALKNGNLHCEVCGFSFIDEFDQEFIECHHDIPISQGVRTSNINDLRLVCSNCHRMLHRKFNNKYLSVEELRNIKRA